MNIIQFVRTKVVFGHGGEVEVPGELYGGEIMNGLIHHTKKLRLSPVATAWERHGQKCSVEQLPWRQRGRGRRWGFRRQKDQKWG